MTREELKALSDEIDECLDNIQHLIYGAETAIDKIITRLSKLEKMSEYLQLAAENKSSIIIRTYTTEDQNIIVSMPKEFNDLVKPFVNAYIHEFVNKEQALIDAMTAESFIPKLEMLKSLAEKNS